jgi:Domain of unknown function (DUF5666)
MNALVCTRPAFHRWTRAALFAAAACVTLLAGCGGGDGVGTGGTGTYAAGTITGFGSIIVNDVRFDDSAASVIDEDDAARRSDQLRLGMTVAVDSDAIRSDSSGRRANASRIRIGSAIAGPVDAIDRVAGTVIVLGQTVRVALDTVLDERLAGGLAGISAGDSVEVYAQYDAASGSYNATRIEPRAAPAGWHLRGPVAALDTLARTLRIGAASFSYAAAAGVPADLAVGGIVRVQVGRVAGPFGGDVITAFGIGVRTPPDRDEAEVKGRISSFASTADFSVDGLPVDASAASFPDGSVGLRAGVRVEVRGTARGGVLRATRVAIESDDQVRERGFELKGAISAVDTVARRFTLRGQSVGWARADLRLVDGTLADIVVGRELELRAQLSPERTGLEATRIQFK